MKLLVMFGLGFGQMEVRLPQIAERIRDAMDVRLARP
jgi:hypothetical protein